MNTGEPWPGLDEALPRVLRMQAKLHLWVARDAGRRFDDLYNLVCDPAFLVVAWDRVRKNKGARTAGVDGVSPQSIVAGGDVAGFLAETRVQLKASDPEGQSGEIQEPGYSLRDGPPGASFREAGTGAHFRGGF